MTHCPFCDAQALHILLENDKAIAFFDNTRSKEGIC